MTATTQTRSISAKRLRSATEAESGVPASAQPYCILDGTADDELAERARLDFHGSIGNGRRIVIPVARSSITRDPVSHNAK
jgi:hypothetical protein